VCGHKNVTDAMNSQLTVNTQNPFIFQLDKKFPMRFAWASLVFIYVLQYPLNQLIPKGVPIPQYDWSTWLVAYCFVLISVPIFMLTLYVGLSGRPVQIFPTVRLRWKSKKRMGLPMLIMVFILFGLWSYLMVNLKIGMTIYTSFDPLPYRIIGILFYGRLFVQPLILAYIMIGYANSRLKWFLFLLLAALGAWVSLTSGSRFASIMFALPMLILFKGKSKYITFGITLFTYFIIASLSRSFYLPFIIGDTELIQVYANKEYLKLITENILLNPLYYIIVRSMGIREVLMTFNFGNISPSFADAMQTFIAYFLPYIILGNRASVKNIYGLPDDVFGSFGLDMFSNFWVVFGGSFLLYLPGLALIGWILGRTHRQFVIGMERFGLKGFPNLVFILLFLLIFEGRAFLFPYLFMMSWLINRKSISRILLTMLRTLSLRRALLPSNTLQSHPHT
jgi:hypothetical protein